MGPTPLLELAAAEDPLTLSKLLEALQQEFGDGIQLPDLVGGPGGKPLPLLLRAAEARRWSVVYVLLSTSLPVSAGQFLASPMAVYCPSGLVLEAEVKQLKEKFAVKLSTQDCPLAEHFHRCHVNSVMIEEPPPGFQREGSWLKDLKAENMCVWHELLHLGLDAGLASQAMVVFVVLSDTEASFLDSTPATIKTLNLQGRDAALAPSEVGQWWLPVLCPRHFLQASKTATKSSFVPLNCIPTPRTIRSCSLRVCIKTCCCEETLTDFDFCVGNACIRAKNVDSSGKEVLVKQGHHRLSAPSFGVAAREIEVTGEDSDEGLKELVTRGFLYFFVQEENLKLTGRLQNIPEDARDFHGKIFFEKLCKEGYEDCDGVTYIKSRFEPFILPAIFESKATSSKQKQLKPQKQLGCQQILRKMVVANSGGQRVEFSKDARDWIEHKDDPCKVKLLTTAAPLLLGPLPETLDRPKLGVGRKAAGLRGRQSGQAQRRFRPDRVGEGGRPHSRRSKAPGTFDGALPNRL